MREKMREAERGWEKVREGERVAHALEELDALLVVAARLREAVGAHLCMPCTCHAHVMHMPYT